MRDLTPLHSFVCVAIQSRAANTVLRTKYGCVYLAYCHECGLAGVYSAGDGENYVAADLFEGYKAGTIVDMGVYE